MCSCGSIKRFGVNIDRWTACWLTIRWSWNMPWSNETRWIVLTSTWTCVCLGFISEFDVWLFFNHLFDIFHLFDISGKMHICCKNPSMAPGGFLHPFLSSMGGTRGLLRGPFGDASGPSRRLPLFFLLSSSCLSPPLSSFPKRGKGKTERLARPGGKEAGKSQHGQPDFPKNFVKLSLAKRHPRDSNPRAFTEPDDDGYNADVLTASRWEL